MSGSEKEVKLAGGNVSGVYRSGDTVRRESKPESPNVHKLLKHLESKGFNHAPKFLGIDEKGREILTFMEGEAGNYPVKKYMWRDESLAAIANMFRLYHDAVSDFAYDESWQPLDNTPSPHEVICHNDFAIYNIVFDHKNPVGIIDFDVAGPGPKLWDIAYALYTCVPLSRYNLLQTDGEPVYYDASADAGRIKRRIALFFEAYGEEIDEDYLKMVLLRLEGLCKTITKKASEGDAAFQKMVTEGHLEHYRKEIEFIRKHGKEWV